MKPLETDGRSQPRASIDQCARCRHCWWVRGAGLRRPCGCPGAARRGDRGGDHLVLDLTLADHLPAAGSDRGVGGVERPAHRLDHGQALGCDAIRAGGIAGSATR